MSNSYDTVIVGAGIFGVTAALALAERKHHVALLDPGPLPHPLAASTDISKVVRMEYGTDETYMAMVEAALPGWRSWNDLFGETLYHEVGVTMLTRTPMVPGGYEYESYQLMLQRGHTPERLSADAIAARFPAWRSGAYVDGYYHAKGGYAESGRVVAALIDEARRRGVALYAGQEVSELETDNGRVRGVRTTGGGSFNAENVLVAAGAWTPLLVPELQPFMHATGHPVFHLQPPDPELFMPPRFVVFTADIARSGWYGFPLHPRERVVKIANHGVGQRLHPQQDPRLVNEDDERALRDFLVGTFPSLAEAPISYTRLCLYCDTLDEHLWIDRHPVAQGLTVATGGSGHGFKIAPVLGDLIADAVEGAANAWLPKFAWRALSGETSGAEAARYHGS